MAVGIYLPFSSFAGALGMEPLPSGFFPWLIGILFAYCLLTQVIKNWFIKEFHQGL
jgi:P-type Mg2+ transporter